MSLMRPFRLLVIVHLIDAPMFTFVYILCWRVIYIYIYIYIWYIYIYIYINEMQLNQ